MHFTRKNRLYIELITVIIRKMKKLIALVVVMLLPLGVFAQDKVAYVYTQEIIVTMPEFADMQKKLTDLGENYRKEMQQMEEEYKRKYTAFVAEQDSLTENIRLRRMQELQDIEGRVQNLMQVAQEDMDKQQNELLMPIQDKLRNAINAVGKEKGYSYIIEPQMLLYIGDNVVDATPFVKTKLGL